MGSVGRVLGEGGAAGPPAAGAGRKRKPARLVFEAMVNVLRTVNGYVPHFVGRSEEADEKKVRPRKRARRWVVEAAHGWFNRFWKLLVRYEKLVGSYLALCHLAVAIIVFRKIWLPENIIAIPLGNDPEGLGCAESGASRRRWEAERRAQPHL